MRLWYRHWKTSLQKAAASSNLSRQASPAPHPRKHLPEAAHRPMRSSQPQPDAVCRECPAGWTNCDISDRVWQCRSPKYTRAKSHRLSRPAHRGAQQALCRRRSPRSPRSDRASFPQWSQDLQIPVRSASCSGQQAAPEEAASPRSRRRS